MTGGGAWRVLLEAAPGQQRALLYDGGRICETWHHFDHAPDLTGSVHKLRIDRVFAKLGQQQPGLMTERRSRSVSPRVTRSGPAVLQQSTSRPRRAMASRGRLLSAQGRRAGRDPSSRRDRHRRLRSLKARPMMM